MVAPTLPEGCWACPLGIRRWAGQFKLLSAWPPGQLALPPGVWGPL